MRSFEYVDSRFAGQYEIQLTVKRDSSLREGDILSLAKNEYDDILVVVDAIEDYPDVSILYCGVNPNIKLERLRKDIKLYREVSYFGNTGE
jgi:hypothetical protein